MLFIKISCQQKNMLILQSSRNFKTNFYSFVTYNEGDNILYKYIEDIRKSYKAKKRDVSVNLFKLKTCNIIAVYDEKDSYIVFYKYENEYIK